MHNIKSLAYDFLMKSKINTLPITAEKLNAVLSDDGALLLAYSEAKRILPGLPKETRLEVEKAMITNRGITIVLDKCTIILYADELSYGEKLLVIAHEIGHKYLEHKRSGIYIYTGNTNDPQEQEAQAFALYLLAPPCILRSVKERTFDKISQLTGLDRNTTAMVMRNLRSDNKDFTAQEKALRYQFRTYLKENNRMPMKKRLPNVIALTLITLAVLTLTVYINKTHSIKTESTEVIVSPAIQTLAPAQTVRITSTGFKYHTPDCYHIADRETIEISKEDAIRTGKAPCLDCRP